jgi:ketosteroid isomerase-like protein
MYDALNAESIERLGTYISDDADVPVIIGTGSAEWIVGKQAILDAFAQQFRDSPGVRFVPGEMHWHEEGDVAWVAERPTLVLPQEGRLEARHTAVLRRERGDWRLVSSHLSIASPDDVLEH